METDAKATGEKLKKAMDENTQDSPSLNIDPATNKPSIVGNPNNLPQKSADYTLVFMYPPEMVKEEEKANMVLDEKTGYYKATVHYKNKRIKPLYRGSVIVRLTSIFTATGVLKEKGYKKDVESYNLGEAVFSHIDDVAALAKEILGVPEDQIEYISPQSAADFLSDLLTYEPNILNESYNFLA